MMTNQSKQPPTDEDKTFDALRRVPFEKMWNRIGESTKSKEHFEQLCIGTGWTPEEYAEAIRTRFGNKDYPYHRR